MMMMIMMMMMMIMMLMILMMMMIYGYMKREIAGPRGGRVPAYQGNLISETGRIRMIITYTYEIMRMLIKIRGGSKNKLAKVGILPKPADPPPAPPSPPPRRLGQKIRFLYVFYI